jgi:CheY-like chemotaxis protein
VDEVPNEVGDDRNDIRPTDRVLLIVENDQGFSRFLLETAREMGFKGLVTSMGAAALTLTREYKPHAISLDINLPDIDGWRVLDRLKNDLSTRHIPVCVISTDESRERALSSGAFLFLAKPLQSRQVLDRMLSTVSDYVSRKSRTLLLFEPDAERRDVVARSLTGENVQLETVSDPTQLADRLQRQDVDCLVASTSSTELWQQLRRDDESADGFSRFLPVIVYADQFQQWMPGASSGLSHCTIRQAQCADRLRDLTAFFLHDNIARLPLDEQRMLRDLHCSDRGLQGKKVLIVDDDMRNIFALSTVLEEHEMVVSSADNGRDAIAMLQQQDDMDIVLMDIMMPEMDGMETMREIRKIPKLKNLPIIAVTAKAMKGDREKCIEAGAWDYLSKPVDVPQMLAVLRAWLHR